MSLLSFLESIVTRGMPHEHAERAISTKKGFLFMGSNDTLPEDLSTQGIGLLTAPPQSPLSKRPRSMIRFYNEKRALSAGTGDFPFLVTKPLRNQP